MAELFIGNISRMLRYKDLLEMLNFFGRCKINRMEEQYCFAQYESQNDA
jgi:hypothetical protein